MLVKFRVISRFSNTLAQRNGGNQQDLAVRRIITNLSQQCFHTFRNTFDRWRIDRFAVIGSQHQDNHIQGCMGFQNSR